ncbi:MAG: hypothetical protein ACT4QE_10085 [Anaerolineales bacterium]
MSRFVAWVTTLCMLSVASLWALPALAHSEVPLGEYTLEYGWVTEPPISGQPNAIVFNLAKGEHSHEASEHEGEAVDVSGLTVELVYGGEVTPLTLAPVNDEPGHFTAAFTPNRPGKYTLRVDGTLDGLAVNAEVEPEEVEPAEAASTSSANWVVWVGVGVVIVVLVGVFVMRWRRA